MTLFLISDRGLQSGLQVREQYCRASDLRLINRKSKGKLFGPWRDRNMPPEGLKLCMEPLMILVVSFQSQDNKNINWTERTVKVNV